MTRLKYYLPIGLLSLALLLSLITGFSLSAIGDVSTQIVGRFFAVPYQIEPRGEIVGIPAFSQAVPARVTNNTVIVSRPESAAQDVLCLDDVVLSAADPHALRANRQRAGLMALLLLSLAALCSASLAVTAVSMIEANRRETTARRAAKTAPRREAFPRRPLPPPAPRRLPHVA